MLADRQYMQCDCAIGPHWWRSQI